MENYENLEGPAQTFGAIFTIFYLVILVLFFASYWKIFEKAGKPGWAGVVPIYNIIVLLEIVGKPAWWIVLFFIPGVNLIIAIIVSHQLSLSFGQSTGFTVGLVLLSIVFIPYLAFSSSIQYQGPGGSGSLAEI